MPTQPWEAIPTRVLSDLVDWIQWCMDDLRKDGSLLIEWNLKFQRHRRKKCVMRVTILHDDFGSN